MGAVNKINKYFERLKHETKLKFPERLGGGWTKNLLKGVVWIFYVKTHACFFITRKQKMDASSHRIEIHNENCYNLRTAVGRKLTSWLFICTLWDNQRVKFRTMWPNKSSYW